MSVDFSKLFQITDPFSNRAFRGDFAASVEEARSYTRGEAAPPTAVAVRWHQGAKTPGDVLRFLMVGPLVVSARVIDVLTDAGLGGWSTYPVKVTDGMGREAAGYAGLAIAGRCGVLDLTRSAIVLRQMPGGWFPDFSGHYFDPQSWDRSDLFMEHPQADGRASVRVLCSDRARRVLNRAKVSNLKYTPLDEYRQSTSNFTIGQAHLLPTDYASRVRDAYARAGVEMPASVLEEL